MRVARLTAGQCRTEPAALDSALRARGFFPGDHVVVATEITDSLAAAVLAAARESAGQESLLVVVAGSLTPKSTLLKGFEADPALAAVPCISRATTRDEVAAALARHGLGAVTPEALDEATRLASDLDGLAREQLWSKLALWQHGEDGPLRPDAVMACAPPFGSGDVDGVLLAVMARDPRAVQRAVGRALGTGSDTVSLVLNLGRLMRQVFDARLVLEESGGTAESAISRVFPPIPGSLRGPLADLLARWSRAELERLVVSLHGLDAALRRGGQEPTRAVTERTLLRLALGGGR